MSMNDDDDGDDGDDGLTPLQTEMSDDHTELNTIHTNKCKSQDDRHHQCPLGLDLTT
jgi:hypothetical protein